MLGLLGNPALLISRIITLIIAFTIHEFAHAKVADMYGDNTPRASGRITLNPLVHLDLFGSLMLLFAGFGWARPVPVNPYQLGRRSPSALMLVSLAGPASNFLLAILGAIPIRLGLTSVSSPSPMLPSSNEFFLQFVFINLMLTFFNLIPLAPLDGDKIADYFFPPSWARTLGIIRPYGPIILMLLVFVLPMLQVDILGMFIYPPIQRLTWLLTQ
jgi:Zn-dependent protease